MLFWYQKCINTLGFFLLVRIFLKVVTEGYSILHVIDEDIVASEIYSFKFVLCSVWLCLGHTQILYYQVYSSYKIKHNFLWFKGHWFMTSAKSWQGGHKVLGNFADCCECFMGRGHIFLILWKSLCIESKSLFHDMLIF